MNHNIANMVAEKVAEKVKQSRDDDLIDIIDIISQGVTEFSLKDLGNIERRIIGFIRRREFNEKLFRILFQFMHNTRNSYGIICDSKYRAIKCSVSDIPMLLEYRSKCGLKQWQAWFYAGKFDETVDTIAEKLGIDVAQIHTIKHSDPPVILF